MHRQKDRRYTEDKLQPLRPGSVRLQGWLDERVVTCIRNGLLQQDVERLVQPFREKSEVGDDGWRCEYWGKWASAAALAWSYQPQEDIRALLQRATRELLAMQEIDGYIGTRKPEHRLKGWDVWGRKYVLLGLLGAYDCTGDKDILGAACRHADCLFNECGPNGVDITALGYPQWKGLPPSSLLEPIVLLYFHTGEKRYLQFAEHIVSRWSQPNRWSPRGLRLVEDALAGKPAAELGEAPKAYEMMSCFEGLCELFRATGKSQYLEAPRRLVENILADELTIIGSGSRDECWARTRYQQHALPAIGMETCVTVTWMKLCFQLLRLTGEARYADELEISLFNALLGALTPQAHWWAYLTGLAGDRTPSHAQHADVGVSCCVMNGPRGLLITPQWAFMQNAEGPVINLYQPAVVENHLPSGTPLGIAVETNYPSEGKIVMHLLLAKEETFTLSLRIPVWCKGNYELAVNGKNFPNIDVLNGYARLRREWHADDVVELKLDMAGRVVPAPGSDNFHAFMWGPLVLAMDNRLLSGGVFNNSKPLVLPEAGVVKMRPNPAAAERAGVWQAFDVDCFDAAGGVHTLTLCDFASAGNQWHEQSLYRVWLPCSLDLQTALREVTPLRWWQTFRDIRPEMPPISL